MAGLMRQQRGLLAAFRGERSDAARGLAVALIEAWRGSAPDACSIGVECADVVREGALEPVGIMVQPNAPAPRTPASRDMR
jgi:hypothetical protein